MKRFARALGQSSPHPPSPGRDSVAEDCHPTAPSGPTQRAGGRLPALTAVDLIRNGASLETAVVAQTRASLAAGDVRGAQAFAESLRAQAGTEMTGRLACGVVAFHRSLLRLAWNRLEGLPPELWAVHAPREYARCGLTLSPEHTLQELQRLAEENPPYLRPPTGFALAAPVLAIGRPDVARQLLGRVEQAVMAQPDGGAKAVRRRIEALRPWAEADPTSSVAPRHAGPTFAVLDYKRPGDAAGSKNIGDHIQSIAALGHLVRHGGVRFTGEPELVALLTTMQERTRPELRRADVAGEVEVITVQRDASDFQQVPDGTWTLCFGWYMHPIFGFRFGFPLNRALRPIFVSFHCNDRALLTQQAVDYLTQYGPVGCRDWTTVHLLLSMGVPAFFSGCLTTTISNLFPARPAQPAPAGSVAYVDVRRADLPEGAARFSHAAVDVRSRSFAANCLMAIERLETYQRDYERIVTSRLHCYLPMRSIGVDVDFRPDNRSDIRFDGLADITDSAFEAMRGGLLTKLEKVFASIVAGSSEDEVYALWRDVTAEDLAHAHRHAEPQPEVLADPTPVIAAARELVATTVTRNGAASQGGEAVHCAVELPPGHLPALRVLVRSLTCHTTRSLHLWVLTRGAGAKLRDQMEATFPDVTFHWLATTGSSRLSAAAGGGPARLFRLMIAEVLPGAGRVVHLPVECVVTGDIGTLADIELGGRAFAAPESVGADASGFGVIHRSVKQLGDRTDAAATLLRNAYGRHTFDFTSFTTDVMVFDLDTMRATGFTDSALGLALEYSMDERAVLHYIAGAERSQIPPEWACVPTRNPHPDPQLLHWVGESKPSDVLFVPGKDVWRRYAAM